MVVGCWLTHGVSFNKYKRWYLSLTGIRVMKDVPMHKKRRKAGGPESKTYRRCRSHSGRFYDVGTCRTCIFRCKRRRRTDKKKKQHTSYWIRNSKQSWICCCFFFRISTSSRSSSRTHRAINMKSYHRRRSGQLKIWWCAWTSTTASIRRRLKSG